MHPACQVRFCLRFASLLLACSCLPEFALGVDSAMPYNSRVWQKEDGLPQNSVYAIAQTPDGYLWVGTQEGLARFDGARFTLINQPDASELRHEWIQALYVARDGALWIAVDGRGVTRLKDDVLTRYSEADGLAGNQPRCFAETTDGSLWIGTETGLTRFKEGKFQTYTDRQGLGDPGIKGLLEDSHGVLQVATRHGLSRLGNDDRFTTTLFEGGWNRNSLRAVVEDVRGRIWTGGTDGMTWLQGASHGTLSVGDGLPHRVVTSLCLDHSGQLWIGTYSGVVRLTDGNVISRTSKDEVSGDLVYTLFEDQEANIWVGARDGLYLLTPARFSTYTTDNGLAHNNVMSVCEDRAGALWIGTWGGGLQRLKDGKISLYTSTNGLTHDSVLSLLPGRDDSLWIGMDFEGGLNRFSSGIYSNCFPHQPGVTNIPIRALYEAADGALWLGTSKGLRVLRHGREESFGLSVLPGEMVFAINADKQGNIWVGTDGGLACWSGKAIRTYTVREGLSDNFVNAIYADGEGLVWIGTRGGGLNRYSDGHFVAIGTTNGLFSDEVYEIIEDDQGFFWMTCRRGLFRASRNELARFDPAVTRAISCTSFGRLDGLLSVQFNGVAKPAGWKARDGLLWFPTIRGVVSVQSRLKTNRKAPAVLIEEISADQKLLRAAAAGGSAKVEVTVPPGRGELEVHYTALSFQAPEKNQFKHRLLGSDPTWAEGGAERIAHYRNLRPGKYEFQVIASNNDGVWNEAGAVATFVLQPHFWQTLWFKVAVVVPAVLLLVLGYRLRIARLREIEKLRVQIAANLHDDVGSRLTKVAMVTDFLGREAAATPLKGHVETISRTTREITQAMDEIVWTINPGNDTLDHLANYIFQYAQEYFQETGIRCRLDLPAQLPDCAISTETRHNIFMAVKEALNNVLKHAGASEVTIALALEGACMRITIGDNGCGFSPEQVAPAGDGLENMKRRLDQIGGVFRIVSRAGAGTVITLEARAK